MGLNADKLKALTKQLYPTGRVFKMQEGSIFDRLHDALVLSEERCFDDIVSTLDSTLADNDNFTVDDALIWENRLGLISNDLVSLVDRKLAIIRKLNHPGTIRARQNYSYLQQQLQLAGFDVYVYENLALDSIEDILFLNNLAINLGQNNLGSFNLGDSYSVYDQYFTQFNLGSFNLGSANLNQQVYNNKVVNRIDANLDLLFNVGSSLRSTFFIGGNPLGTFANVDQNRKDEFRQLILKIKPVQTVGYLLINYI